MMLGQGEEYINGKALFGCGRDDANAVMVTRCWCELLRLLAPRSSCRAAQCRAQQEAVTLGLGAKVTALIAAPRRRTRTGPTLRPIG